jgi:UDP-N-acetylglucosamine acyltransferase
MPEITVLRDIHPSARIADHVEIGPYCFIGPDVTVGSGTVLRRRISITACTCIGADNTIDEGCVFGGDPQDLKYRGSRTVLIIGDRNRIGRSVTAHIGTEEGGYVTRIGDDNVLDDGAHVAHDCYVDDHTHLGAYVQLGGHIHVQTGAVMGELSAAHHFTTIGRYAWVGPHTPVRRDVPPYTRFSIRGQRETPAVVGIHDQGVLSAGLGEYEQRELLFALRELFSDEAALQTKIEQLSNMGVEGEAASLCEFCQRSLQGVYGRFRATYRGKIPPEAQGLLDEEGTPLAARRWQ